MFCSRYHDIYNFLVTSLVIKYCLCITARYLKSAWHEGKYVEEENLQAHNATAINVDGADINWYSIGC